MVQGNFMSIYFVVFKNIKDNINSYYYYYFYEFELNINREFMKKLLVLVYIWFFNVKFCFFLKYYFYDIIKYLYKI